MGMIIFEESGAFNPIDYGLNVGDTIHVVCVGGGGGTGRSIAGLDGGGSSGVPTGGGGSGEIKFANIKLSNINSINVTVGKGGAPVDTSQTLPWSTNNGNDGESSSFGDFVVSLGGFGSRNTYYGGPAREHGYRGGNAVPVNATAAMRNGASHGAGGAGGWFPSVSVWGGNGADVNGATQPSALGGGSVGTNKNFLTNFYGALDGQDGLLRGAKGGGVYSYLEGLNNETLTTIYGGAGGSGYGAGAGGAHRYMSTGNISSIGGADGCVAVFW